MLSRLITTLAGWAVALFYDVERTGPSLPDGPVLVTANHPNALVDPLVIFRTAGRITRPLAKAPLFEQALVGTVLKGLGGLPVYRKQDDPSLMHQNDQTFDAAIAALQRGEAVQIYPEGQSHSEAAMTPLRTGAARIALMAEERSDWSLGLRIQPVGLTYTRKHLFRGRAIAAFGESIRVADWKAEWLADSRTAARGLTEAIRAGLEGVTLNFDDPRDSELVDVAERVYVREKGLASPRGRDRMADRLPRLQRFQDGLRFLETEDPGRLRRLRMAVARYMRLLSLFGARDGDVPHQYRFWRVVGYTVRELLFVGLVAPVATAGEIIWFVPAVFTDRAARRFRPKHDQIATYKLSIGMLAFPFWYSVAVAATWILVSPIVAWLVLLGLPLTAFALIAWRDRKSLVLEDLRVFARARRRSQSRDRMAEQRVWLVAEFDAIVELQERRRRA